MEAGLKCRHLPQKEERTYEEWLRLRRTGIGGSDISAVCGINPWRSPMDVFLDKIGQVEKDEPTERMKWGSRLEKVIADGWEEETGRHLIEVPEILQHRHHDWALCNVDRIIDGNGSGNGVLEIKSTSEYQNSAWDPESLKVPDYYMLQLQWMLWITELDWGEFGVLIGGNRLKKIGPIAKDDNLIADMKKIAGKFWENVTIQKPPELDGSEASKQVLDYLYPEGIEEEKALPDACEVLLEDYNRASAEIKSWTIEKTMASNKLKGYLGAAAKGIYKDYRVNWTNVATTRLDTKKLKSEKPDIYREYSVEAKTRRFSIRGATHE